jgi:hypothetical protein
MKHLQINEMENIDGGSSGSGCLLLALTAGALTSWLGPVAALVAGTTYVACSNIP